jgi:uncharacterized RDD family membrane protein YckC
MSQPAIGMETLEYAGFWVRVAASLIDTVLVVIVTAPLLYLIYGQAYFDGSSSPAGSGFAEILITWVAPAVAVIAFWLYRKATPGKMVFSLSVVDAKTGAPLTVGQSIGRYFAYLVSAMPLCLGFLWVAFDSRKQGWHDKLAGTVVVRRAATQPVKFTGS